MPKQADEKIEKDGCVISKSDLEIRIGRKLKKRTSALNVAMKKEKQNTVKAVMFAPFMRGSKLAKELKEAEKQLAEATGSKMMIVERCGTKLADLLTKSNPWKGKDCLRKDCLLCKTKAKTEKKMSQDCMQRSVVYETRCLNCEVKAKDEIMKMRKAKYIGETGKSSYERGRQQVSMYQT